MWTRSRAINQSQVRECCIRFSWSNLRPSIQQASGSISSVWWISILLFQNISSCCLSFPVSFFYSAYPLLLINVYKRKHQWYCKLKILDLPYSQAHLELSLLSIMHNNVLVMDKVICFLGTCFFTYKKIFLSIYTVLEWVKLLKDIFLFDH